MMMMMMMSIETCLICKEHQWNKDMLSTSLKEETLTEMSGIIYRSYYQRATKQVLYYQLNSHTNVIQQDNKKMFRWLETQDETGLTS